VTAALTNGQDEVKNSNRGFLVARDEQPEKDDKGERGKLKLEQTLQNFGSEI
jgi:hypothetical protein